MTKSSTSLKLVVTRKQVVNGLDADRIFAEICQSAAKHSAHPAGHVDMTALFAILGEVQNIKTVISDRTRIVIELKHPELFAPDTAKAVDISAAQTASGEVHLLCVDALRSEFERFGWCEAAKT